MRKYLILTTVILLLSCDNTKPIIKVSYSNEYDIILRTDKRNTKFKAISFPFNVSIKNNSSKKRELSYNSYIGNNLPSNKIIRTLYSKTDNKLNRERNNSSIVLNPKSKKKFIYYVSYIIDDTVKFPNKYFEKYLSLLKKQNKKDSLLIGKFIEFKRKNPKLIDDIMKNDSISFNFPSLIKKNKYDVVRIPVEY